MSSKMPSVECQAECHLRHRLRRTFTARGLILSRYAAAPDCTVTASNGSRSTARSYSVSSIAWR